jgi:hypothetical protein
MTQTMYAHVNKRIIIKKRIINTQKTIKFWIQYLLLEPSISSHKKLCLNKLFFSSEKKKMCYLYTMEFYSTTTTKKNEILPFAGKWMELENII